MRWTARKCILAISWRMGWCFPVILGDVSFSVKPTHAAPAEDSLFLCFRGGKALLARDGQGAPALPVLAGVRPLLPPETALFELAHTCDQDVFVPDPLNDWDVPEGEGLSYQPIRAFHSMPFSQGAILTSAWHLWSWYRANRFCGACGGPMEHFPEERAVRCPRCGALVFPRIAPAVIVAITAGDEILLARNVASELDHYALIAGYVEVGETVEHAVKREVMEEVGLTIGPPRYLGDQPWGVSGALMFAFQAEADRNAPLCLQESEIADAKWVRREDLSPVQNPVSIAYELMERFRTHRL